MRPKGELSRQELWRETCAVYALMTLITVTVGFAQGSISALAGYGALISALAFIYLPTELLIRRGEPPQTLGIGAGNARKSALNALRVSLMIFPLYGLVYHVWQEAQGNAPHVDARSLSRWGEDLRGRPMTAIKEGDVRIFAQRDRLTVQWRLRPQERAFSATLTGWHNARIRARSKNLQIKTDQVNNQTAQKQLIIQGGQTGTVTLSASVMDVSYQVFIDQAPVTSDRIKVGALLRSGEPQHTYSRNWWWVLLTFATQLLLVAIPEEIFYRGYIQGRLDQLIGEDRALFGAQVNLKSVTLTSLLFALAHLATIHHPARLAVFFPSLLFGWMRRAYGNTLTPAIFHALCNVLSQLLWGCYAPL